MIMRDNDKRVMSQKVPKSHLMKWMSDNKFLIKDSQVQYHDIRKAKDRFEWNKFKRSTITFEQICQIRNRNSIFSSHKCDNKDKRIVVPGTKPMTAIRSSLARAVLTKYIDSNRNSKFLTKKFKELSAEINEIEIKQIKENTQKRKLTNKNISNIDLGFIKDPTHEFQENTSLFANPNFSSFRDHSHGYRATNSSMFKKDGPMRLDMTQKMKKRNTSLHSNMHDFEDRLLTNRILKGKKMRSLAMSQNKAISPSIEENTLDNFRQTFSKANRISFGPKRKVFNSSEFASNSNGIDKLNSSTKAGSTYFKRSV
jgi:hypothetical protein